MSEHDEGKHEYPSYTRIYIALVVLLAISVAGNFTGVMWITLIIAFGVALLKANLVVQNFMHLKTERRIIKWMLATSLMLIVLFMAGTMSDIMKHHGVNWVNVSAQEAIAQGIPLEPKQPKDEHPAPVPLTAPGAKVVPESPATSSASHAQAERADPSLPRIAEASVVPLPHRQGFDAKGTFNSVCATCHGQNGKGDGVAAASLNPKPANFTDPAFWKTVTDSVIFKAIKDGGASVGKSPMMVAWGGSYTDAQIHDLIKYIKTTFKPKGKAKPKGKSKGK